MTLDIAFKKGKRVYNKEAWAVSRHNTPADLMSNSPHTMDRLATECYGKTYKGEKRIIIKKIRSEKIIGYVNSNAI